MRGKQGKASDEGEKITLKERQRRSLENLDKAHVPKPAYDLSEFFDDREEEKKAKIK